jgi:hypothetical protein
VATLHLEKLGVNPTLTPQQASYISTGATGPSNSNITAIEILLVPLIRHRTL